MKFQYRYLGHSTAHSTAHATQLSFAPDTLRSPVFFEAELAQQLPFREAISALHDVVLSDLRPPQQDRTAYFAWLQEHEPQLLADFMAQEQAVRQEMAQTRSELDALRAEKHALQAPFLKAQQRYFDYLYQQHRDAWFVLDPVITVHPDKLFFECFSRDEASYAALSCSHESFRHHGAFSCGTTNIDYSAGLYQEFQQIRDYRKTTLAVAADGFAVQHGQAAAFIESQIELPDSWVRGFLQVSSAMTLPAHTVQLHPMDVYNICHVLRRRRERTGPRSIRFFLQPGAPLRMRFEPWSVDVHCPRSIYTGSQEAEIRIWGRRRLLTLQRLIPVAERFTVHLLGNGMPSFWIAHLPGGMQFTLGLSGWTANDWASQAQFDLLGPRHSVAPQATAQVLAALQQHWLGSTAQLAAQTGLPSPTVVAALVLLTQAGRVVFDLVQGLWRLRELSAQPLPLERLRYASEREAQAAALLHGAQQAGQPVQVARQALGGGRERLQASVADGAQRHEVQLELDADARLESGRCQCNFFTQNQLRRGPCAHMLAVRMADTAQRMLQPQANAAAPAWAEVPGGGEA